ncbi:MAG: hypothetical protein WCL23_05950 [Candidatus Moraniibacteriota bacterium]
MKRVPLHLGIIRVLSFASLFLGVYVAEAQDATPGFSIDPFYKEISIAKDQEKTPFSLNVTNHTAQVAVFRVSVLDFGALDESGGIAFSGSNETLKYSLASWVSLQNDTLVVQAGQTESVNGYVENRESLSPGGHYGAIYLKNEDTSGAIDSEQNVSFNPSMASLLFVRKVGGEIYGLDLDSTDFTHAAFSLPDSVKLRFRNTGNVHVTPRGTVAVIDPLGKTVERGIINEPSSIVLPESFRSLKTSLMRSVTAFVPGRYTLYASYRFDGKEDFSQQHVDFFFIPPMFIISVTAITIALAIFIRFRRKRTA